MRNTKQKELILDIINHSYSHPNAQSIYEDCRRKIPNISLGTVYRNLNLLVNNSMIKRIKMPDNTDRYDKIFPNHAHFICIRCGKVIDLDNIDQKFDMINNNKVLDYEISFKGICKDCLDKESEIYGKGTKGN